jgi:hypothetical protein
VERKKMRDVNVGEWRERERGGKSERIGEKKERDVEREEKKKERKKQIYELVQENKNMNPFNL